MRMFVHRFGVKTGMCHKQKYGPGFYAELGCMAVVNLKPTQFYGPVFGALPCSSFSAVRGFSMGKREINTLGKTGNFETEGEINFSCILSKI